MNESNPSDAALAELLTLTMTVDAFGITIYRNHLDQTHRIHGPAVTHSDEGQFWFRYGRQHRTTGPAAIWADGHREWHLDGERLTEEEWNERVKSLR